MREKSAVLINPGSGRGKGKGLALAGQLRSSLSVQTAVIESFEQLAPVTRALVAEGANRLYVSGGDGTVDAVLTVLAESGLVSDELKVVLLPHGTTNMTAKDIGLQVRSVAAQADFIERGLVNEVTGRHTMRIANAQDGVIRHGMFLGVGAVAQATRYSQGAFNDRGLHGNAAPFAVLAKAVAKTVLSRPDPTDSNRFDRPFPIDISTDKGVLSRGDQLLAICTTLNKLILGSRPFWGDGDGPIRVTVLPYPLPNVIRWIGPVLYGRARRRVPPGAVSVTCNELLIGCPTSHVLDGEFLDGPKGEALRVETGARFNFVLS